jgi:hypothetical protein
MMTDVDQKKNPDLNIEPNDKEIQLEDATRRIIVKMRAEPNQRLKVRILSDYLSQPTQIK